MRTEAIEHPAGLRPMPGCLIPALPPPSETELAAMMIADTVSATDGCEPIEPDGCCSHGHVSWLRYYGLV